MRLGFLIGATMVVAGSSPTAVGQFVEGSPPIHTLTGEASGDTFGWVSERIGDLDGDGSDDFVVTSTGFGPSNGKAYAYSGATGASMYSMVGTGSEQLGYSIDRAQDPNLDGIPDILISGPFAGAGSVYIKDGSAGSSLLSFQGQGAGDRFGYAVGQVGDATGTGSITYVIGAPFHDGAASNAGRAYLVSSNGTTTLTLDGEAFGDRFGSGAGGVGDLNHDGVPDFAVSAMNGGPGNRGRAYFLSGVDGSAIHPPLDADATGRNLGQYFTSGAGDVDADGWPDVYISDFDDTANGPFSGKVYIVSGATGVTIRSFVGGFGGEGVGPGRGAGDANGDGYDDLIIAAWSSGQVASGAGRVDLFSGKNSMRLRSWTGNIGGDGLGFDAHSMGDVNADGSTDFLLTAAQNDAAGSNAGRAYLVSGGLETLAPVPGGVGGVNQFETRGAFPGETVIQVIGLTPGSYSLPCSGLTLNLSYPFWFLCQIADSQGSVSFPGFVPASLSGVTLYQQGLVLERCTVGTASAHTFP